MADTKELANVEAPLARTELQTFSDEAERTRLTGTALNAFRALAERWRLSNGRRPTCLGFPVVLGIG